MSKLFENSFLVKRFFVGELSFLTKNSLLLKFFKLKNTPISFFLVLLAIISTWYEPVIKKIFPFAFSDALPIIFLFAGLLLSDFKGLRIYKLHFWYLAFLFLSLVSGFLAVFGSRAQLNAVLYFILLAQFLIALLVGQIQNSKKIINGSIILGIPILVFGLWQFFSGKAVYFTSSLESIHARASATFTSPNVFGMFSAILFLVSLFQYQKLKEKIYLVLSFLFLLGAVASLSRTAWLALVLGSFPLIRPSKLKIGNLGIFSSTKSRVEALFNGEYWFNASIDGRIWSLKNSLHILKQYPILGTGPGTYGGRFAEIYSSPVYFLGMQNGYVALLTTDNQYLAILVQLGILGFLFFAGFWLAIMFQVIFLKNRYRHFALAILISFAIMMLTSNALEFTAISVPTGILLGLSLKGEL